MSTSIPFIFKSAPSISSYTNPAMPCYDCSMLGYSTTCTSCSPFIAGTPPTTPSSPAKQNNFKFDFSFQLANAFSVTEPPFNPKNSVAVTEQPRSRWTNLEAADPSTKTSRFNWTEMGFSNDHNTFENLTTSSLSPEFNHENPFSDCLVCSLVPYGALCTSCNCIQTSTSTPSPTSWPIPTTFETHQGTIAPEEELLQNLDMQLFKQINVPRELDNWGRRVYDDSGNRLLYYQDEDGNTVIGYEAWYPCSVIDEYEQDPRDRFPTRSQIYDITAAAHNGSPYAPHHVYARPIITATATAIDDDDDDDMTVISGYETFYSCRETPDYENSESPNNLIIEQHDSDSTFAYEQERFAEYLATQDEELPRFASDRERIAKWIEGVYIVTNNGAGEDLDYQHSDPSDNLLIEYDDSDSMLEYEQLRFKTTQEEEEMSRLESDRERIARWVAGVYVVGDDEKEEEGEEEEEVGDVFVWEVEGGEGVQGWGEAY